MPEVASLNLDNTPRVKRGQPKRIPISEIDVFDHDRFVRNYKSKGLPVVIKGGARHWPAVGKWTPAYFAEHFGDKTVTPSMNLPDTEVPYQFTDMDFRETMTIREFVQRMKSGERCYIDQVLAGLFEGMDGDYRFDDFQTPDIKAVVFWLGSNTRSGLHYDHVDNFFAQICGSKLAIIAEPLEGRNLHLFPDSHTKSQIAPEHPDAKSHPRVGLATLQSAELEAGDVLYLPQGWWHYFASSADSISLACWHGVPMTPADEVKFLIQTRNYRVMAQAVKDFFWHGVFGRPYQRRLYSPPPTGVMLHQLISKPFSGNH